MANRIRTGNRRGFNKGRSSKFREGSQVWQTLEEGRRAYRPKHCGNNNKDEDNSSKTLDDKYHQASSQKFRQLILPENTTFFSVNHFSNTKLSRFITLTQFLCWILLKSFLWITKSLKFMQVGMFYHLKKNFLYRKSLQFPMHLWKF